MGLKHRKTVFGFWKQFVQFFFRNVPLTISSVACECVHLGVPFCASKHLIVLLFFFTNLKGKTTYDWSVGRQALIGVEADILMLTHCFISLFIYNMHVCKISSCAHLGTKFLFPFFSPFICTYWTAKS
jgi:hypothetical protein